MPVEWTYNEAATKGGAALTCTPGSGVVPANSKQAITLRAQPGIPDVVRIAAHFDIAHFDPVIVHATMEGTCGAIMASLPRMAEDGWVAAVAAAAHDLQQRSGQAVKQLAKTVGRSRAPSRPGACCGLSVF